MRSFINKNVMKEKWKSCGYVDEPCLPILT